jgi:hypothetical protein
MLRNLKERHPLADPGLGGDIILKIIWKKDNGKPWQYRDKLRSLVKTVTEFRVS